MLTVFKALRSEFGYVFYVSPLGMRNPVNRQFVFNVTRANNKVNFLTVQFRGPRARHDGGVSEFEADTCGHRQRGPAHASEDFGDGAHVRWRATGRLANEGCIPLRARQRVGIMVMYWPQ